MSCVRCRDRGHQFRRNIPLTFKTTNTHILNSVVRVSERPFLPSSSSTRLYRSAYNIQPASQHPSKLLRATKKRDALRRARARAWFVIYIIPFSGPRRRPRFLVLRLPTHTHLLLPLTHLSKQTPFWLHSSPDAGVCVVCVCFGEVLLLF